MLKFNLEQQLKAIIGEFAFSKGLKEEIVFSVEIPPKNINADLALNAAMVIAKKKKQIRELSRRNYRINNF
jgi:arginyl-tRNA synthetase